nr:VIT1/CCC1 transporter family protein [uncultured Methanolobus sp.]
MTFTSVLRTFSDVSVASHMPVVYSALFCCIAWGLADGLFYVWERRYNLKMENEIIDLCKSRLDTEAAMSMIHDQLSNTILSNIDESKRQDMYLDLISYLSAAGRKEFVRPRDAFDIVAGTILVSTLTGLIVLSPFFAIPDMYRALAISNWLGIILLFVTGYYRTYEKSRMDRLRSGLITAVVGMTIAVVTVVIGG